MTACRGLGIDVDIAQHISGMIPFERGSNWSLNDCFYGNEEKNRKPVKELINEVEKYPKLKETALKLEGLVNKRSVHAGGVLIFNDDYRKTSAMMKAPNGQPVTQFNLDDSEALGGTKFDLLTVEALDKIRATLDMLLEYNEIEWQGSLRETFNKYLHPDVLEHNDSKLWEMLGSGEIMDLFQFSTQIGNQSVVKVKPKSLLEMAATNSLMRLMSDGEEQPVDTFIKHRKDISLWYKEMKEYSLTDEEIRVLEEHLLKLYGVADTQESVMLLSMDQRIAGFDVVEANKLRKSIAKKKEDLIKEIQKLFFKKGKELGTSENLLRYVWEVQIKRQLGYSFSILHTMAYSTIALQELNLNYYFNPLYWATACLTVNAGSNDEDSDENHSTNYGKIAEAIGNIQQRNVKVDLPYINKAGFGFKPDIKNNSIVFGLKGLNGIGDDVVHEIIKNRPYNSFSDFLERMFNTGMIKKGQIIQLIKAGCFDEFGDRKDIMEHFVNIICEPKTKKLNMQNFPALVKNNLIPEKYHLQQRFYKFRKYLLNNVYKVVKKPKDKLLLVDEVAEPFFNEYFTDESVVDFVDGHMIISEKKFKKEYDKLMQPVKEWVGTNEALEALNNQLFENEWNKYASGSLSKWEMDSLSYYYHEHELDHVDREKYGIVNYFDLPEEPKVVNTYKIRGIEKPIFDINRIVGTVLDKNKNKHTVTLLTPDGVVTVKQYSGQFSYYNKQISQKISSDKKEVLEKSWYTRGNLLLISGFRRGNQFVARTYKNSIYQHTVCKINSIDDEGNLSLTTERVKI